MDPKYNPKLIRAAVVLPYTGVQQILLQKKDGKYKWSPFAWKFFGGEINEEERPINAAIRELEEEGIFGIMRNDLRSLGKSSFSDVSIDGKIREGINYSYALYIDNGRRFLSRIRLNEGAGFALFEESEIDGLCMPKQNKEACIDLFNKIRTGLLRR